MLDRRGFLVASLAIAAGVATGGCARSRGSSATDPGPDRALAQGSSPSPRATPAASGGVPGSSDSSGLSAGAEQLPADEPATALGEPTLPVVEPWRPGPYDVRPTLKAAAVALVTAAGTWGPGSPQLVGRLRAAGFDGLDPATVWALDRPPRAGPRAAAVAQVVVAQYGGLLARSASVIVVVRQTIADAGELRTRDATWDVRLAGDPMRVTAVLPATPRPAAAGLSNAAREVLASDRLQLPAVARADVAAGFVGDPLLHVLLGLAARWPLAVSVLGAGHPYRIFDKPAVSDHSRGRAVDIWRVDGAAVVEQGPKVDQLMRAAAALGAYQVGGPRDLGPRSAPYYTDPVHQDHVHVGVRP
ncbi:MAG: hypothetical protein EPO13_07505 [Actinomycetota bacterium]|nr:MAG: hypothetical protein EPO13_07505 [Actinomycetota bacterium]